MSKGKIKYYKINFSLILILVVGLFVYGLSKFWYYFNSGADRALALNIPVGMPGDHLPYIKWLPDEEFDGLEMSDEIRRLIVKDYIHGWYQKNVSYLEGKPIGLKDYFTSRAYNRVIKDIGTQKKAPFFIKETDLEHYITLHYFSADGQIVSFTDQIRIKKQFIDKQSKEAKLIQDQTYDYDIVMILDQDYWRIKSIKRKNPETRYDKIDSTKSTNNFVQVKGKGFVFDGVQFSPKGVNYYPQKTPWNMFGVYFDPKIIDKDFLLIKNNGFNLVRIFVNFQDFNKGSVSPFMISQLNNVLDIAEKNNLKVILTLFDFVGDYQIFNYTSCDRQLETILGQIKERPSVFAIDIKNEPDLDFHYQNESEVRYWLDYILERVKKYDPNHLITIGWAFPENASNYLDQVDFVSFHSYRSIEDLKSDLQNLKAKVVNKPLILEEYGMSSYKGLWSPFGNNTEDQKLYFSDVAKVLKENGDIPYVVWTLYDFDQVPTKVVGALPWRKNPQKYFGLIDLEGKPKPSMEFFQKENR